MIVAASDRRGLRRVVSALLLLYPADTTWPLLDQWVELAVANRQRCGFRALLIAALAVQNGSLIWSLDGNFARMETLDLIHCYSVSR